MTRNLAQLSWMDVRELDKTNACVVLPVGAIEQHGPHLPVLTDTLLVEHELEMALERLPANTQVWRLPALNYGKSNEHDGYPGTFSLSAVTLMSVVRDVARGVKQAGFTRLVLLNSHGGNRAVLDMMARELRVELGLLVFSVFPPALVPDPVETTPLEKRYGIHAGDWETSVLLALQPGLVKLDRVNTAFPDFPEGAVTLTTSAAHVGWLTRDWSATGTFGDATAANAEKGRARLEAMADQLAVVLAEIALFPIPQVARDRLELHSIDEHGGDGH
jgi:creatinine amidohydrolase/Fe(II)-dependent formamide hydrolase-like protein